MRRLLLLVLLLAPFYVEAQSHMYRGGSTYTSNILYTFDGKYLYRGNSTYSSDIIYTFDGQRVYRGNSTYSSDILYTLDGEIPVALLVLLM